MIQENVFQCGNCERKEICGKWKEFEEFATRIHEMPAPSPFLAVAFCPHYIFDITSLKQNGGAK